MNQRFCGIRTVFLILGYEDESLWRMTTTLTNMRRPDVCSKNDLMPTLRGHVQILDMWRCATGCWYVIIVVTVDVLLKWHVALAVVPKLVQFRLVITVFSYIVKDWHLAMPSSTAPCLTWFCTTPTYQVGDARIDLSGELFDCIITKEPTFCAGTHFSCQVWREQIMNNHLPSLITHHQYPSITNQYYFEESWHQQSRRDGRLT